MTDIRPNDIIVGEDDVQKAQGILSGQGYSISSRLYFKGTRTANGGYTPGKSLLSISGGNVEEARNILKQNNIVAHTGSTTHLNGSRNQAAANDVQYAQPNRAANNERYAGMTTPTEKGANPSVPKNSTADADQGNRTFGAPDVKGRVAMQRGVTPQAGQNRLSSAAYGAGYALGNKVTNARNAIVSAPQNARDAVARKQAQVKQGVMNAKNLVMNAPSNIKNAALNKQKAAQNATGAKAIRGRLAMAGGKKVPSNWNEVKDGARNMAVKGGPVLFWLVAGIAVIKDIIDVASVFIDGIGLALEATVVGVPVGVGLQVLSEMIDKLSGLFIDVTVVAYFGYIGGGFALRLVIMSIGAIIDAIPVVDVLPLTTVSFFAAYLLGRVAKKATQLAESAVGKAIGKTGAAIGGAARMGGRFVRAISR